MVHYELEGEDWATGILTLEDSTSAFIDGNHITFGGMDDRIEIYGTKEILKLT